MAKICLHNFLKTINDTTLIENRTYCPLNFVDTEQEDRRIIFGAWRNEYNNTAIESIRSSTAHRSTIDAYKQRDNIVDYFLSAVGEIPWQYSYVRRGFNGPDIE